MNKSEICPTCGSPVNPDSPCPKCLLGVGLESMSGESEQRESFSWSPPDIDELSDRFPELELIELLGRGGMGAVYKARQPALDRLIAIKILPPEIGRKASFAERFSREAKALAKLNHPNIVTVHDFGERDGLYFFMMEFVDGVNLRQLLDTGRVSAWEALAIVPQICDALQCAHDQGIVHRDIKPENILMDRQGRVKIADFGLARLVGEAGRETLAGEGTAGVREETEQKAVHTLAAVGTPAYMAPEQVDHPGEVDHRADIYALGVVFYQMLTGELPGREFEPPSRRAVEIDVRLDEIVLQALEKDPVRRYSQVSILKTRLEDMKGTEPPGTPAKPPATTDVKQTPRPWIWMSVFLVLHFIAATVLMITFLYVVPKFTMIFMDMGVALPVSTRITVDLGGFVQQYWFALMPLVVLIDGGLCLLLTLGRLRKLLITWGVLFLLGTALFLGVSVTSLFLVMHDLVEGAAGPQASDSFQTTAPPSRVEADILAAPPETPVNSVRNEDSESMVEQDRREAQEARQLELAREKQREVEEILRVQMVREQHMVMQRKKALVPGLGVAVIVLLAFPLTIGAIIWIILGVKKGCALGRSALFLATGLPFFDLSILCLPLWFFVSKPVAVKGQQVSTASPAGILLVYVGLFIALELCACLLGFIARRTTSGKAAMVIAGILTSLALLLFIITMA